MALVAELVRDMPVILAFRPDWAWSGSTEHCVGTGHSLARLYADTGHGIGRLRIDTVRLHRTCVDYPLGASQSTR
eukprot:90855-Rhodomonas_salina.1